MDKTRNRKTTGRENARLAAQETDLHANPFLRRFAESRRKLAADPYRPIYHFVSPESGLNDPNGLCSWRGKWHLFYQGYPPENPKPHWGHAVSDDLVHWRDLPYAIFPGLEDSCWSGSTLVEEDRVIAMYHGHQLGNMVAVASDPLLLDWQKVAEQAIIPIPGSIWTSLVGKAQSPGLGGSLPPDGAINFVYDPCIWKKNGLYYSISGGALPHEFSGRRTRAEFLFCSRDLKTWEYLHPFCEGDIFGLVGDDGACPYFWPIGDRHILLHFSHMSGGAYMLGDYDTLRDKFVVTSGGRFNFGAATPAGVHAPSATPDGKGGVIVIFNINPGKPTPGWNQIMSLPRRLALTGKDELKVQPAGDIASLRGEHQRVAAMSLPANREVVLDGVGGNTIEILAEIDPMSAPMVEMNVLRSPGKEEITRIAFFKQRGYQDWERFTGWDRWYESCDSLVTIDSSYASELPDVTSRAPETAPVYLAPEETLRLRVFIDKSVVEVFVNDRQCLAVRVYPGRSESTGVSLRAQGADAALRSLDVWQMKSIYDSN
jgi:beta-fructofuranosidase